MTRNSTIIEPLLNILEMEKDQGYQDRAVAGGLDKLLQRWDAELTPILDEPGSYSVLTPVQRETWVADALKKLDSPRRRSVCRPQCKEEDAACHAPQSRADGGGAWRRNNKAEGCRRPGGQEAEEARHRDCPRPGVPLPPPPQRLREGPHHQRAGHGRGADGRRHGVGGDGQAPQAEPMVGAGGPRRQHRQRPRHLDKTRQAGPEAVPGKQPQVRGRDRHQRQGLGLPRDADLPGRP